MTLPRPRTIRGQLMAALVLFELIVVGIFTFTLVHQQGTELNERLRRRLENQAYLVAAQGDLAAADQQPDLFGRVIASVAQAPSVAAAQITDMQGRTLASTDPTMMGKLTLSAKEKTYLRELGQPVIFSLPGQTQQKLEAVAPIRKNGHVTDLVWIYPSATQDRTDLHSLLRITLLWALFVLAGCTAIAGILAQSISKQLRLLTRATRRLIQNPEDTRDFPLPVQSATEAADLTIAFNRMVAAMQDQRSGLNETLALLDSMLANAPIGFAFFDRKYRFVRVNQFLAEMNGYSFALHLGRGVEGILPPATARKLEQAIETVFVSGEPQRDVDLEWEPEPGRHRSWVAHLYPVRTEADTTRWVGAILVDTTEQKRAEETLRRTEKLAATGRLAASIAHEINNPLEAVTNLLYLIRQENLTPSTAHFAEMAQQEVTRVSEITQQTLRFYRQSTLPGRANVRELLDSVLTLHLGRVQTLQVDLQREYGEGLELFCFAGEMRQLFANLIGNALDAMTPAGGRLVVRAQRVGRDETPGNPVSGIRVTVADTGCGITTEARRHIFEPFFTTKEATGTGLGLWVSEQIIRKHHGSVRVRSRSDGAGTGTVFSIFFPTTGLESEPVPAALAEPAENPQEERTLSQGEFSPAE
ncbi:MAG TPA: ATP-binding protein [Acidobacteriaceae bacterium]|jgi:PAS domain S-box-containing protein|nr:ATP-binding protein [Acidobacteriaceae bacterium]